MDNYNTFNIFTNDDYDVVKIDVSGSELHQLNKKLQVLPHTNNYPKYQPHVTIAYVKKGQGKKYVGIAEFKDKEIHGDHIVFSSKNGNKSIITLPMKIKKV